MNELQMIKAFAELEGVEALEHKGYLIHKSRFNSVINSSCSGRLSDVAINKMLKESSYSPIQDLALNCKARDDYEVQKTHSISVKGKIITSMRGGVCVNVFDKKELPRAAIECILKSKGLYHE